MLSPFFFSIQDGLEVNDEKGKKGKKKEQELKEKTIHTDLKHQSFKIC